MDFDEVRSIVDKSRLLNLSLKQLIVPHYVHKKRRVLRLTYLSDFLLPLPVGEVSTRYWRFLSHRTFLELAWYRIGLSLD